LHLFVSIATVFEQVQAVIGPYVSRPAACREYDPRAAVVARQIAALIHSYLPQVHAEHVGSTAVPGCAGKGIVDLLIPVAEGDLETVKQLLDRLGFQLQPGPDPFPEDRPMRVGAWTHDGETFLLHVHLLPAASPEADEMRFFRACLRADPQLVAAYVAHKREILAGGITDSLEYCRLKGQFVKTVLG
jgi:GrpB-like predicted nucleotidyltransferase (UPF0157 family)